MLKLMIEFLAETIECRRHKKDIFNMLKRTIGNNSNNNYYCQLLLVKLSSKVKAKRYYFYIKKKIKEFAASGPACTTRKASFHWLKRYDVERKLQYTEKCEIYGSSRFIG